MTHPLINNKNIDLLAFKPLMNTIEELNSLKLVISLYYCLSNHNISFTDERI